MKPFTQEQIEALKAAGISCETVPELDKFNPAKLNKLVE